MGTSFRHTRQNGRDDALRFLILGPRGVSPGKPGQVRVEVLSPDHEPTAIAQDLEG